MLLGLAISTLAIPQCSCLFRMLTLNKLFPPVNLRPANTSSLVRFWRVVMIVRADLSFIGSDALQRRFVDSLSAVVLALRCIGRSTRSSGQWIVFTAFLLLVLSSLWHLPLLLSHEVFEKVLLVLLSIDRGSLVRSLPHVPVLLTTCSLLGAGRVVDLVSVARLVELTVRRMNGVSSASLLSSRRMMLSYLKRLCPTTCSLSE